MKLHMMTLKTKMRLAMSTLLGVLGMPGMSSRMFDGLSRPSAILRHNHTNDDELLHDHSERGDVPGWVMVTLMTAGLVILIWALAGPALSELFQRAIDKLTGI